MDEGTDVCSDAETMTGMMDAECGWVTRGGSGAIAALGSAGFVCFTDKRTIRDAPITSWSYTVDIRLDMTAAAH